MELLRAALLLCFLFLCFFRRFLFFLSQSTAPMATAYSLEADRAKTNISVLQGISGPKSLPSHIQCHDNERHINSHSLFHHIGTQLAISQDEDLSILVLRWLYAVRSRVLGSTTRVRSGHRSWLFRNKPD
ncbi:hypothetical protein F4810DRAFT_646015 [Camillea tinctor]|nr:hypothetical protein F4810DRAFT_646015 [Camillea tinctor]